MKFTKNKKGFSILEVIISAFVLSIGIVAVMGLISSSLKNSVDSRNQIIASELAQEGVELVRNVRDTNYVKGSATFANFYLNLNLKNCTIDKDSGIYCNSNVDKTLYYNGGYYNHTPSSNGTVFHRRIMFEYYNDIGNLIFDPLSAVRVIVSSVVSWKRTGNPETDPPKDLLICTTANKCAYTQMELSDWK